jgi:PAS domain S-box-containing protein
MNTPPRWETGDGPEHRRRYDLLLAGLDLLDQAIAVFDVSPNPKLVTWNKALLRLLDFPESLVRVGTPFEAFVRFNAERGEYGEGPIEQLIADRMASARAFQPHYAERARPNGRILAIRGVPIPNLGFVSLWTDITEQRRYEEVIQQQNLLLEARVKARTSELEMANARLAHANAEIDAIAHALRRSERRLELIIDSIPALVAYVDRNEDYRFANLGYAQWFGLSKEEIVGQSIARVFGPETYHQIAPHLQRAHAGERVSYEYKRKDRHGHTVYARSVVVPETDALGTVVGFFVMGTDITEQKASQAALVQAQKMEAVGQLTGGLAHDFNNLLTIIIGNLCALESRLDPHLASEYLRPSLDASRRGAELIRQLLSFSRRQSLEPRSVEVGERVFNITQLLRRTLGEAIKVRLSLPPSPLHAFVDPHQLENALLNLALNARDAMPEGGVLGLRVSLRTLDAAMAAKVEVPEGPYVQIDVSDTGQGIPDEWLSRVFEPFFTTKDFGRGSGLGLSMVYGFVRQSGGNIRLLSTLGQGTHVRFVLPCCPAATPTACDENPAHSPPPMAHFCKAPQTPWPAGPVLLVEDDPQVRKVIRMQLVGLGCGVIEAEEAKEALNLLEQVDEIALVISDVVMPGGFSGYELLMQAKARRPTLPFLLMTGYAHKAGDLPESFENTPLLRKPFDHSQLALALHALRLKQGCS